MGASAPAGADDDAGYWFPTAALVRELAVGQRLSPLPGQTWCGSLRSHGGACCKLAVG